jgi:hypothetical protein
MMLAHFLWTALNGACESILRLGSDRPIDQGSGLAQVWGNLGQSTVLVRYFGSKPLSGLGSLW